MEKYSLVYVLEDLDIVACDLETVSSDSFGLWYLIHYIIVWNTRKKKKNKNTLLPSTPLENFQQHFAFRGSKVNAIPLIQN